ncbi:MAG: CBS domain-containing protein [Acidobacteria bacterium]|nr:CBS domain-containing protein [Acidobacteriota bacterium]
MKTVQQLLHAKSGPVLSIAPGATVYDALALMARHDIGALIVLENDLLCGMFSERDYARKVILHGRSSRTLSVADVMTRDVVSVTPAATVDGCMGLMTDRRIRHLPVLEGTDVVGLVSIGDLVKAQIDEQRFVIAQLENYITT